MSETYEVIVAGAGPAGATAAYFLGEAGKRVLVLEKATLPRYKACGGGLSIQFLEKRFPFSLDPIIDTSVNSISYISGGRTVTVPVPHQAIRMVMRDRFDAYLLAHAQADVRQGAAVRRVLETADGVLVETADGRSVEGDYLIGADGANSVVARSAGLRLRKTMAAAIEAEVPVPPEVLHRFAGGPTFIFGHLRLGYLWIFPKADHLSVGIGALHPRPGELQATLRRVMAPYGISLDDVPLHGHPVPVYLGREPIATNRVLLAGDAAGLVDPFLGEGIRPAIESGRLAAEAILSGHPDHYPEMVYRQVGRNYTFALTFARLFYRFPDASLLLLASNPFTTGAFMDLVSGRSGYPEVLLRIFGMLPFNMLVEGIAACAGLVGGWQRRDQIRAALYRG